MLQHKTLILLGIAGFFLTLFSPQGLGQENAIPQSNSTNVSSVTLESATGDSPDDSPDVFPPRQGMQRGRMQGRGGGIGPGPLFPRNDPRGLGSLGRGIGPGGPGRFGGGPGWRQEIQERIESPDRIRILRRDNPELADLIEKLRRLRYQIDLMASESSGANNDAGRNRIKKRLQPLLEEEFDLDSKRQDMEIEQMEKRLQQLRNVLHRRREFRSRLIELKAEELVKNPPAIPSPESIAEPTASTDES